MGQPAERTAGRTLGGRLWQVAGLAAVAGLAWTARDVPAALGGRLTGTRAERAARSAQFRDGTFHNRVATRTMPGGDPGRNLLRELLFGQQRRRPTAPVPLLRPAPAPTTDVARELNVVWYGHASTLVEIEGHRVLIDPVWSDRCSPSAVVGPKRLHEPRYASTSCPPSTRSSSPTTTTTTSTWQPFGNWSAGSRRRSWCRWASARTWTGGGARRPDHRAGLVAGAPGGRPGDHRDRRPALLRPGLRRDGTLWSSWVVAGAHRKVFYTGDSGYFDGYAEIGAEHGPFDVTLMQIGAYDRAWPGIHMFPEEAVAAHLDLRGDLLVPVHWATFNLALHDWSEPVDRLWAEAKARGVRLTVPRPGERVVVDDPPPVDGWWQAVA